MHNLLKISLVSPLKSAISQPTVAASPDGEDDMMNQRLNRREMLQQLGGLIGLAAAMPFAARVQARTQGLSAVGNAFVSLTATEAETLRAIIGRIIPTDENGPGALEARADRFIDRGLAGALRNQRPAEV